MIYILTSELILFCEFMNSCHYEMPFFSVIASPLGKTLGVHPTLKRESGTEGLEV